MADRGSSLEEKDHPREDFVILAKRLRPDAILVMLDYVWQAYDRLRQGGGFAITKNDWHLEDEITAALHARIQDIMRQADPFSPFAVVHQPLERGLQKQKGRPPQSDLGFRVLGGSVRSHFSIEAKVIRTDGGVSQYVKEIRENFLTGRYSTHSSEAAMIGYLLSGTAARAFHAIAEALQCALTECASFPDREHRCSCHPRDLGTTSGVAAEFHCHHLMMPFG